MDDADLPLLLYLLGNCQNGAMNHLRRPKQSAAFAAFSLLFISAAQAAPDWLIATPDENVRSGAAIGLEVVRPDAATPWPDTVRLRLQRRDGAAEVVTLNAVAAPPDALRRSYAVQLPLLAEGVLRAELAGLASNRLALIVTPPQGNVIERMAAPADLSAGDSAASPRHFDPLPENEPALSANEPLYFLLGARDGLDARFQLSFKYRLFDAQSLPARLFAPLGQMHLGYTQTSLWDLAGDSKPFRDTSYRPSLFWQGRIGDAGAGGLAPDFLRGGYEHESNGRDGSRTRSIDMLFLQPTWRKDFADGQTLLFAPRFQTYFNRADNPDIAHYRGYADWILRYGNEDGWLASARLRRGSGGQGSAQIDLSYPLREPLFSRVGGFLHFQIFTGYGQTLLDFDVKRPPQLRVGFSIVR